MKSPAGPPALSGDPSATLYERSSSSQVQPSPVAMPSLIKDREGYIEVSFDQLASFAFPIPPYAGRSASAPVNSLATPPVENTSAIPANIRALDNQRVRLEGFMLPVRLEAGQVRELLLLRSQMLCCYGLPPAATEWVVVKVKGRAVPDKMDVPLAFFGMFHVGEIFEDATFEGDLRIGLRKIRAD